MVAVPFYIPTSTAQGSNYATSSPTLIILFYFGNSHAKECEAHLLFEALGFLIDLCEYHEIKRIILEVSPANLA